LVEDEVGLVVDETLVEEVTRTEEEEAGLVEEEAGLVEDEAGFEEDWVVPV
jgi:hypothetical protein